MNFIDDRVMEWNQAEGIELISVKSAANCVYEIQECLYTTSLRTWAHVGGVGCISGLIGESFTFLG